LIDGCFNGCIFVRVVFQKENEENVLVCIRIILELHKAFRPQMNEEVLETAYFVYKILYSSLFAVSDLFHKFYEQSIM
jgi:transformation/transcription domain-associated protein